MADNVAAKIFLLPLMNREISITLLLLLCFQFFFKAGIAGYYFANKDYIAKVLCINRDKAEMHCDGKCYLMQKMKSSEKATSETLVNIKYEPVEFVTAQDIFAFSADIRENEAKASCYPDHYTFQFSSLAFQPPC